jgi:two-component system sensor histidine kinase/response regulator
MNETPRNDSDDAVSVLVVDDSHGKLLSMEAILQPLGARIVCAQSGRDALRKLLVEDFAVVLLDVNMPDIDGFETARLIRERQRSALTPIIFITSMNDEAFLAQGYSLGAVDYILAPVMPDVLQTKVGVFVDLYRRRREVERRAEEQVALIRAENARDEAQRANRAKTEFLANISHELRTPMNAIIGMTDLALGESISPTVRDYLETTRASADLLLALLNELLDVSRLESGKFKLEPAWFDLRQLVEQTVRSLAHQAHDKDLDIVCDIPARLPAEVIGDGLRIRQILTNLIANAIKFTDQGRVLVRIRAEYVTDTHADFQFSVIDSGIGIRKSDQKLIFSPFTQGDSASTRKYGGSGLGLAIASHLVHLMGSEITLESEPGHGSQFSFTLRLPRETRNADSIVAAKRLLDGKNILLAHPNNDRLPVLQEWLDAVGVTARFLPDAAELHECLATPGARDRYDAIVLDAELVGTNGERVRLEQAVSDGLRGGAVLCVTAGERQHLADWIGRNERLLALEKPVARDEFIATLARGVDLWSAPAEVEPARPPLSERAAPSRSYDILVAEDTPANQKLLSAILGKRGHRVSVTKNGAEALDALAEKPFDMVLMDLQMPVMDGLQATAAIRALPSHVSQIPIIALTAHAMRGDDERCLAAGMDAYLAKPIDARELLHLVDQFGPAGRKLPTSP